MRIICPNCAAQYEVDDALIPETGRDVQCSNCGKGWFQPKHEPSEEDQTQAPGEDAVAAERANEPEPEPEAEPEPEPEAEPEPELEAEPSAATEPEPDDVEEALAEEPEPVSWTDDENPAAEWPEPDVATPWVAASAPAEPAAPPELAAAEPEYEEDADAEAEPPPQMPAAARRSPDEATLGILREEAEREIAARRQPPPDLESQPDLGLDEGAPPRPTETVTRDNLARLRGEIAAGAAAATVTSGVRRELLPNIDEINSTLRADADRSAPEAERDDTEMAVREHRRGFRLGFALMLLIAAILMLLYVYAPVLAARVPALEGPLLAYLEWVNGLRDWFDALLSRGVDRISTLLPPEAGQ